MTLPPAIVIHGLEHARLALAPGRPVTLLSAPAAGLFAGCSWWRAVIDASRFEGPDLLDCADAPGRALEALSVGCRWLVLHPCPAWESVAERAGAAGCVVLRERPVALDLAERGAARRIEAWLGIG